MFAYFDRIVEGEDGEPNRLLQVAVNVNNIQMVEKASDKTATIWLGKDDCIEVNKDLDTVCEIIEDIAKV